MARENEGIPSISHAIPNQGFFLTKQYWDHLALALKSLETDNTTVASIVSWSWVMGALLNSLMN
jgi:hypothetical protein